MRVLIYVHACAVMRRAIVEAQSTLYVEVSGRAEQRPRFGNGFNRLQC